MAVSYDFYRIFYYVAKYSNITQAARVLLSNQPNLTRTIKTLESELGCQLFTRSNRGMKLTPEGARLFAHVRVAFESIEAGEAELAERREPGSGMVSVAVSEIALHLVLLPALKKYRARYPRVRLKISNHSTPQALEAIQNMASDLAVVTTSSASSGTLEEVTVRRFREVAVCSGAFPELAGPDIPFSRLADEPLISLGTQTKAFELYARFFADRGLRYRPEIEVATADQILPLVRADLGIGFVPREFLAEGSGLTVIQTQTPLPEREIRIVKRRDQALGAAARELERLLLEVGRN